MLNNIFIYNTTLYLIDITTYCELIELFMMPRRNHRRRKQKVMTRQIFTAARHFVTKEGAKFTTSDFSLPSDRVIRPVLVRITFCCAPGPKISDVSSIVGFTLQDVDDVVTSRPFLVGITPVRRSLRFPTLLAPSYVKHFTSIVEISGYGDNQITVLVELHCDTGPPSVPALNFRNDVLGSSGSSGGSFTLLE